MICRTPSFYLLIVRPYMETRNRVSRPWCHLARLRPHRKKSEIGGGMKASSRQKLGDPALAQAVVEGGFETHIAGERSDVGKGQDLGGPVASEAILTVDPVEQVGQTTPAERARRAAGRRLLVIDHEGERPGFRQTREELRVVRQRFDDAGQRRHLE